MKSGLDFVPLDVSLDDKFELLEGEFGLKGFAVIVKLFQKIYGGEGYYCEWTKDVVLLFSKRAGFEPGDNTVSEIAKAAIRRGIFDKGMYDKYSILTSNGIQKRFFKAAARRQVIEVKKEYLLNLEYANLKNVNILSENDNILSKNDNIPTVKECKELKENETNSSGTAVAVIKEYENNMAPVTKYVRESIIDWCDKVESGVVIYAIHEAAANNKCNWKYVEGIIRNHYNAGRKTLKEVEHAATLFRQTKNIGAEKGFNVFKDNVNHSELEQLMHEKYDG